MADNTSHKHVTILSRLLLQSPQQDSQYLLDLREEELGGLLALANKHHVVIRSLEVFSPLMRAAGNASFADWAGQAMEKERARISHALPFLDQISAGLREAGCEVIVIKSLDHWPDLGNDLDLYSGANPAEVVQAMRSKFDAHVEPRSWGDRMANKWNFIVPGLPEAIEIHIQRLGQTGEHVSLGRSLAANATLERCSSYVFSVPAPEHRVILATLQRMYRHFYFRLCDIVNTTRMVEGQTINYPALRALALEAGIWKGTASYLAIVSDYVRRFRGRGLDLPDDVKASAAFGGDRMHFAKEFLRIPIMPDSVQLYFSELKKLLWSGDLNGTARLSVLPCLATAAALGQKLTGSDKGIW